MRTSVKTLLAILLFLSATLFLVAYEWPAGGPKLQLVSSAGGNHKFVFTDLPDPDALSTYDITGVDFDNWKVFVNFDDGTYFMGTKALFEAQEFVFGQNRLYNVYAELTPTYDDGDVNPGLTSCSITPGIVSTTWENRFVSLPQSQQLNLSCTRWPKLGDPITFIITCQNSSSNSKNGVVVGLTFDPNYLELMPSDNAESWPTRGGTVIKETKSSTISNGMAYVEFSNFSLNPNEQKNFFIRCKTKTAPTNIGMYRPPFASIKGGPGLMEDYHLNTQTIVTGHDPNQKYPEEQTLCLDKDYVDFTITFQNDGNGPTKTVEVIDELDWLIDPAVFPNLISWSTPQMPVITKKGNSFSFLCNYPPPGLHGLGEVDYGHKFLEDASQGAFTFRCQLRPERTGYPCNALVNRAKIYFDCNTPVKTNAALAKFNCTSCDTICQSFPDSTVVVSAPLGSDQFLMPLNVLTWLTSLGYDSLNPTVQYKWYPPSAVNNAIAANPYCIDPKQLEYTLVVSSNAPCKRQIVHLKYPDPCTLGIQIDASNLVVNPCARTISGYLMATATGTTSTGTDLQWHQCDSTGNTFKLDVFNGVFKYHFGLTDKITGCTKEVVYSITMPPCKKPWWEQISLSQWALAAAIGLGLGLIWRFLRKNR